MEIDPTDRRILGILQEDASLAVSEIAERVNLSTNPCWRRIKRLEAEGIISRRVAILDEAALGLSTTAFVSIRISAHDKGWLERFSASVRSIPEIIECHRMSGQVDYMLKVLVRDIAHYDRVYQKLIGSVPNLADVSSTFSMERLKHGTHIDLSTLN